MHTYIQRQNQQVNRRHIKITYLCTALEPPQGICKSDWDSSYTCAWSSD